jgi:hypothetical protein
MRRRGSRHEEPLNLVVFLGAAAGRCGLGSASAIPACAAQRERESFLVVFLLRAGGFPPHSSPARLQSHPPSRKNDLRWRSHWSIPPGPVIASRLSGALDRTATKQSRPLDRYWLPLSRIPVRPASLRRHPPSEKGICDGESAVAYPFFGFLSPSPCGRGVAPRRRVRRRPQVPATRVAGRGEGPSAPRTRER